MEPCDDIADQLVTNFKDFALVAELYQSVDFCWLICVKSVYIGG